MASVAALEGEKAYFIRPESAQKYADFTDRNRALLGSGTRYNSDGDITYVTFHDLPPDRALSPIFIPIAPDKPNGNIYSHEPAKIQFKEIRVHTVRGGVEVAIRAMDHILMENTAVETMGARAHTLLDIFQTDFGDITQEAFAEAKEKTLELLKEAGLDPDRVISDEITRIGMWLVKGSFGADSKGRRNRLIATMALSAAYRHAVVRWKHIAPTREKFVTMREALIFEQQFSRTIFRDVLDRLRPESLPAHKLFKYPQSPPDNGGVVLSMLRHLQFQLHQPHVKPYRTIGKEAETIIAQVEKLLREGKREEITRLGLFDQANTLLSDALDK